MAEMKLPDMTSIGGLQQRVAELQAKGNVTPEDMAELQVQLQKWNQAIEVQSQLQRQLSDTLKSVIQKMC